MTKACHDSTYVQGTTPTDMLKSLIHAVFFAATCLVPTILLAAAPLAEIAVANESLTLAEAIHLAAEYNPRLSAATHEVEAFAGAVTQAGVLPNPEIGLGGENLGNRRLEGGDGRVSSLQIKQLIELGGKRAARVARADAGREYAKMILANERASVSADAAQRFVAVLAAQERLKLTGELLRLAEETTRVVTEKVKAGKVMPLAAIKTEITREAVRIKRINAERELAAARRALTMLWGEREPGFGRVVGELAALPAVPDYLQLTARLAQSPLIQRWSRRIVQRKADLDLAKAKGVPDVTIMAGVRRLHELDEDAYIIGASIPLLLFDRNQGGQGEAIGRLAQARDAKVSAEFDAETLLSLTWHRLAAARERVQALKATVLPGAERVFQAVRKGYQYGKFDLLDVLDAQRVLFDSKSQYLAALTEAHYHIIDLERLLGGALSPHLTEELSL
jgi:cobalt-zinc-cadmium efflux system outer membrane protein